MQGLSAGPAETAKPYRIRDLTPKSCDDSHEKGQLKNFMAELHLWVQAWSHRILVRVESVDKVSTVVSFFVRGALRADTTHWAFPPRLPKRRLRQSPCTASQDPEPTLSSCSSTRELRQTTDCVSPDRLASRLLSLLHHSVILSPSHFESE